GGREALLDGGFCAARPGADVQQPDGRADLVTCGRREAQPGVDLLWLVVEPRHVRFRRVVAQAVELHARRVQQARAYIDAESIRHDGDVHTRIEQLVVTNRDAGTRVDLDPTRERAAVTTSAGHPATGHDAAEPREEPFPLRIEQVAHAG